MRTANYESGATSPPPKWRNRIKEVREEQGHNQRQLARLAGLDAANLNAYEQGRLAPSVATLLRLTRVAGVQPGRPGRGGGQRWQRERVSRVPASRPERQFTCAFPVRSRSRGTASMRNSGRWRGTATSRATTSCSSTATRDAVPVPTTLRSVPRSSGCWRMRKPARSMYSSSTSWTGSRATCGCTLETLDRLERAGCGLRLPLARTWISQRQWAA